jgi:3-oxoacyl-[acyl-carrier-protein] synthase-3
MALFSLENISITGISASIPKYSEDNSESDLIPEKQREAFIETTGIRYRRIVAAGMTAADLCYSAAERLLDEISWRPEEIDVLIFVTQTPDYIIPNSASVLQYRLNLSKKCIAFDINLGCSGYVYGLSVIGALLQNIPDGKGLLLVGDCSSSVISSNDKSTYPLFSDAGSATAIEHKAGQRWRFNLPTDGKGHEDIMVKGGGMRNPFNADSLIEKEYSPGEKRNDLQMKLDGVNIFNFALREVTPNIEELLVRFDILKSTIDHYVFHQANKLIIESVRKKLKEGSEKIPYSLYHFGNTSSASIPVTIVSVLKERLLAQKANLLLSGFGVGLSWGSVYLPFDDVFIPSLIEI